MALLIVLLLALPVAAEEVHQFHTPSGHFRILYRTEGWNAVDLTDADGSGVPDPVELISSIAEEVWQVQIEELGFKPPSDVVEIDVYRYFRNCTAIGCNSLLGQALHERYSGPNRIWIDSKFHPPSYRYSDCHREPLDELNTLRGTMAHEFFHVVQRGYIGGLWSFSSESVYEPGLWEEATASWMEDVVYPDLNEYAKHTCDYVNGLESFPIDWVVGPTAVGSSILAHFIEQNYGRDLILRSWKERSVQDRGAFKLEFLEELLREETNGEVDLGQVLSDLAVWLWFTGDRHRQGFFADGAFYAQPWAWRLSPGDGLGRYYRPIEHQRGIVKYYRLEASDWPDGAEIRFNHSHSDWRSRLILVSDESYEIHDVGSTTLLNLESWNRAILVVVNWEKDHTPSYWLTVNHPTATATPVRSRSWGSIKADRPVRVEQRGGHHDGGPRP